MKRLTALIAIVAMIAMVFVIPALANAGDETNASKFAMFETTDQTATVDGPDPTPHPWAGRRSLGVDAEAGLPLFKEIMAAMDDKKVAARAADIYGRVAQEMAAQEAVLDHLKGQTHD